MPNVPAGRAPGRYYTPQTRGERGGAINPRQYDPVAPPPETAESKAGDDSSDFWSFVGDVAPTVGTLGGAAVGAIGGGVAGLAAGGVGAIPGGIAGGAAGASLGGALGSAVGGFADGQAANATADREKELTNHATDEEKKADRKQALIDTLMQLKRS